MHSCLLLKVHFQEFQLGVPESAKTEVGAFGKQDRDRSTNKTELLRWGNIACILVSSKVVYSFRYV